MVGLPIPEAHQGECFAAIARAVDGRVYLRTQQDIEPRSSRLSLTLEGSLDRIAVQLVGLIVRNGLDDPKHPGQVLVDLKGASYDPNTGTYQIEFGLELPTSPPPKLDNG